MARFQFSAASCNFRVNRVRVKICGITRTEDAAAASAAGADAIGLVFHDPSPRAVTPAQAAALAAVLPPFVTRVGLFVDASPERVRATLDAVHLDLLQFHGDEPPEYCAAFGRPWLKAIRLRPGLDLAAEAERFADACGLLVDAWHPELPGGTGELGDWSRIPERLSRPLVLAGGLTPDNVGEAIARVRPWAVDVSSGVESEKGIKDAALIEAFMQGVNRVHTQ